MPLIVNGEWVSDAEIDAARQQLKIDPSDTGDAPDEDPGEFLRDMVVARVLVKQEAMKRPIAVAESDIERELDEAKEQCGGDEAFQEFLAGAEVDKEEFVADIRLRLKVDALLDEVCKDVSPPTEKESRQYYEENRERFQTPELFHVAHIVKHVHGNVLDTHGTYEALSEVLKELDNGASFKEVAARVSDCPDNGGDLGLFPRGAMVPDFENVIVGLKKGEISGVFETPFGLHIAMLIDRIPQRDRSYDEVAGQVSKTLHDERENAVIDAFVDELRKHATIEEAGQDPAP